VPLEWIVSVYEATLAATQAGIAVVAAAGNGGENLDAPEFNGRFDRQLFNSGAIIVGAGSKEQARLEFSCYGSRLDLQGWGREVTTTGYGHLFGTSSTNFYTNQFSGTSSASPLVAAAVAAVQGHLKASGRPVMTAAEVAALLKSTGSPQTANVSEWIGPLPNPARRLRRTGRGAAAATQRNHRDSGCSHAGGRELVGRP
jgi:serine protease